MAATDCKEWHIRMPLKHICWPEKSPKPNPGGYDSLH